VARARRVPVLALVPEAGPARGGLVVRLAHPVLVSRGFPLGSAVIDDLVQVDVFHDLSVRL
jgi:hypothetical protein